MTKLLFTGVLACTVALAAHPATFAGERQRKLVAVGGSNGWYWAEGNVGDVFNSQGTVEFIGCRANAWDDGLVLGSCWARDEKKQLVQCLTDVPEIVQTMLGINGDSTIYFEVDGFSCKKLAVTNSSRAAPKRQTTPEDAAGAFDMTGNLDEVQQ